MSMDQVINVIKTFVEERDRQRSEAEGAQSAGTLIGFLEWCDIRLFRADNPIGCKSEEGRSSLEGEGGSGVSANNTE